MTHGDGYREEVVRKGLTVRINGTVCLLERPIQANRIQDAETVVLDWWGDVPVVVGCRRPSPGSGTVI